MIATTILIAIAYLFIYLTVHKQNRFIGSIFMLLIAITTLIIGENGAPFAMPILYIMIINLVYNLVPNIG